MTSWMAVSLVTARSSSVKDKKEMYRDMNLAVSESVTPIFPGCLCTSALGLRNGVNLLSILHTDDDSWWRVILWILQNVEENISF